MNATEHYFRRAVIGGIPTDLCSEQSLTNLIVEKSIQDRTSGRHARLVFDINGHGLALAAFDSAYAKSLLSAEVVHADGQPIVWASRVACAESIPERTATTDLIHAVGRASESKGLRVFFLGAKPEVIDRASKKFLHLYPTAQLAGHLDGYFAESDLDAIVEKINRSNTDVVFVGLGKPREQVLCSALRSRLEVSWLITAGGCFDFLAGDAPRAPAVMQKLSLEWLYRLSMDPRRLAWRYLWTNTVALMLMTFRTRRRVIEK